MKASLYIRKAKHTQQLATINCDDSLDRIARSI